MGDGVGETFDKFGGFLVGAVATDDGAINFQELRGFAEDASNLSVIHGRIISLGRWRFPLKRKRELNAESAESAEKRLGKVARGDLGGNRKRRELDWFTPFYENRARDQAGLLTFAACGPFGPWTISNSTGSPSCVNDAVTIADTIAE